MAKRAMAVDLDALDAEAVRDVGRNARSESTSPTSSGVGFAERRRRRARGPARHIGGVEAMPPAPPAAVTTEVNGVDRRAVREVHRGRV